MRLFPAVPTALVVIALRLSGHALAAAPLPTPELTPLNVASPLCRAAQTIFDEEWHIVANLDSPVADVCGATSCVGINLAAGTLAATSRTPPPTPAAPRPTQARLAVAFNVTCPDALDDAVDPAPCPALSKALTFPSERAEVFAMGTGPKARWLVNEVSGDDAFNLTAKTHIYDAATHRHLGFVTQKSLYSAPELVWVTDACALVSMPFPSSEAHPARLLCAGTNRLVSTIAHDELIYPGPIGAVALSGTRLAMWHVGVVQSTLRVVALPGGRELRAHELPFVDGLSDMASIPPAVFDTNARVLAFASHEPGVIYVIDPIAGKVLRAWQLPPICP